MTEQAQVSEIASQNQSSTSVATPNNSVASQPAEKYLSQSEVNELVGRSKKDAYEKGKLEALADLQKQSATTAAAQPTINSTPHTMGGMTQLTPDQIQTMIHEGVNKGLQEKENLIAVQRLVNEFATKMENGKSKYTDFEQVVTPLQLHTIPHIVQLANGFDNTADIMYDLGKNPTKIANLLMLANANQYLAQRAMQDLSDSIKQNQNNSSPNVKEPLSQIKPSNVGTDNGSMTISDLRKQPWLRA